jgi:hypothetical protein
MTNLECSRRRLNFRIYSIICVRTWSLFERKCHGTVKGFHFLWQDATLEYTSISSNPGDNQKGPFDAHTIFRVIEVLRRSTAVIVARNSIVAHTKPTKAFHARQQFSCDKDPVSRSGWRS